MKLLTIASMAAVLALGQTAFAAGEHVGGHDEYAIGMKAEKTKAKRTINITMREDQEGRMIFEPKKLQFRQGETVTLNFVNKGATKHEFVMDTQEKVLEHKVVMEKNPDMEHADDNSLSLEPGEKGQIIWTFAKSGDFAFACLIPGHYESGMHGPLKVTAK